MKDTGIFQSSLRLQQEPNWFLRWGTYVLVFFFFALLILSCFFSYNEVISGRVTVTSVNPPVHVQAKQTGKLLELRFKVGDKVSKDEVLAVIDNPAMKEDIDYLKKKLLFGSPLLKTVEDLRSEYPLDLNLGNSLQPYYRNFLRMYQQQILDGTLREDVMLQEQILSQLSAHKTSLQGKIEEMEWSKRTLELVQEDQIRNHRLYEKGIISKRDFEKVEKELNEEQLKMQLVLSEYNDLLAQGQEIKSKEIQLKNQTTRSTNVRDTELLLAHQELVNAIISWEDQFLLRSPIDGRLSFVDEWGEIQSVSPGEIIFTIVPLQRQQLIGKAILPGENSGKMRLHQKAVLRLDNYPPREWGTVNATVRNFAQMPIKTGEAANLVYFEIPELTTSYGKQLEFNQDLLGTVEVLVDEVTIMERVFYQFRHLWSNKVIL